MDVTTLLDDLQTTRHETLAYYDLSDTELSRTYGPGKWSIRYILQHLSDSETVFYDRICRVLSEPRQVLWVYDENAWANGIDYSKKPLALARPVYDSLRTANAYYVETRYESEGHREFVHSVTGVRTLKDEMHKIAAHNAHHLAQIKAALGRSNGVSLEL
jgi:DinB superfamily